MRKKTKIRYVDKVKRPLVRPCPGAKNHFCCNYVVVSHILNCPYNCSYCYLHTFFGKDEIVVFKDEEEVVSQVKAYMEEAGEHLRIGTGEFSDSLALPDAVSLGKRLVKVFSAQNEHLLELKTKSVNINEFLSLEHSGKTVMAWSVNPEKIVQSEELGTPSLAERIKAAKKCVKAGYPVAFHFDPILFYSGWDKDYKKVVDLIFSGIDPKDVAWISLGALRYQPKLKDIIEERFSHSRITFGELNVGEDGKMRYCKPIRIEIFKEMHDFIHSYSRDVYVYLCMESTDVWQAVDLKNSIENPYARYFKFFKKKV